MPWPELPSALQQGVIDGQENPIPLIITAHIYEMNKYIALTRHSYEPMPLVISKKTWDKLNHFQKEVIKFAGMVSIGYNRGLNLKLANEGIGIIESKGGIITRPDLGPFKPPTTPVREKFFKEVLGSELTQLVTKEIKKVQQ
jgi:TRAP-type C4-dicarboxylate transport system substrate-binding protein